MKRIYLSGPMTGMMDFNFPAFYGETLRLMNLGYEVVNPAEINDAGVTWHECMRRDLKAMLDCDTLALLPGWENSQGAHLEMHVAHRCGIRIVRADEIQS